MIITIGKLIEVLKNCEADWGEEALVGLEFQKLPGVAYENYQKRDSGTHRHSLRVVDSSYRPDSGGELDKTPHLRNALNNKIAKDGTGYGWLLGIEARQMKLTVLNSNHNKVRGGGAVGYLVGPLAVDQPMHMICHGTYPGTGRALTTTPVTRIQVVDANSVIFTTRNSTYRLEVWEQEDEPQAPDKVE